MRHYETMYIVDPDVSEETLEATIARFNKVITDGNGEVIESGLWDRGRRQLAYPINRKREGIYVLMQYQSEADVPKELDRLFRISDDIMRHLIIRTDDKEE